MLLTCFECLVWLHGYTLDHLNTHLQIGKGHFHAKLDFQSSELRANQFKGKINTRPMCV